MCCWLQVHGMQWISLFFEVVIVASCNEYLPFPKKKQKKSFVQLESLFWPFSSCKHIYIAAFKIGLCLFYADLLLTCLVVQGCTMFSNTPRQDFTYVLYMYTYAMNRTRHHRCRFLITKFGQGPDLWFSRTASNELSHSNLSFLAFAQLLSVDSPVVSQRQEM